MELNIRIDRLDRARYATEAYLTGVDREKRIAFRRGNAAPIYTDRRLGSIIYDHLSEICQEGCHRDDCSVDHAIARFCSIGS